METTLLQTKFYIPRARPPLVSRPHLIERLNAGSDRKLTLISAPAGFGKTTLLSEWIHSGRGVTPLPHVAWLTLDEGDNDPVRFWTYAITALQTIQSGVGETTLAGLQAPQPQLPPFEIVLTFLINDIASISAPFILVLDDYHVVKTQLIHDGIAFLLDHLPALPANMHLVIASRVDPPLPLPRLRIRGDLNELRNADLRFTPSEVAAFFHKTLDINLSAEDIAALEARTEGWVASLQVATLSMRGLTTERVSSFIQAFTGSHRYILDYLVEEVLERQPESLQSFLLQTAVLGRLSGPLCDAVVLTGEGKPSLSQPQVQSAQSADYRPVEQDGSQAILEHLERTNLFIVSLDDERCWYRYHHLFADLLRARLNQAQPDLVPELHRRASAWCEQNGFAEEALGHALDAGEYDRAASLVEGHFWPMMRRGEVRTVLRWLQALPIELVRNRPQISLCYAQVLGITLQLDDVELHLRNAECALRDAPSTELLGWVDALRASLTRIQGDTPGAIELIHRALERIPEDNLDLRGIVTLDLGVAHLMGDDLSAAGKAIAQAIDLHRAAGNDTFMLNSLGVLAEVQVSQGRLYQAAETYRQAIDAATGKIEHGQPLSPAAGMAYAGLSALEREWNDLDAAIPYALKAIELGERTGLTDPLLWGHIALARARQVQGDMVAALDVMQEAVGIIQRSKIPQWMAGVDACQVRLWLAQLQFDTGTPGRDDRARQAITRWLGSCTLRRDWRQKGATLFVPGHPRDFEHLTLARAFIAQNKLDEALELLSWLHPSAQTAGRMQSVIEILVLQVLALHQQGDTDQAMTTLNQALVLAEPEGYVRLFLDEGRTMVVLLRQAVSRGIVPYYASKLLGAFSDFRVPGADEPTIRDSSHPSAGQPTLIEPLTDREHQVLRLLGAGLSNREIAEELYLSIHTVKTHARNIYGKLDVRGRLQAVQRARELELL